MFQAEQFPAGVPDLDTALTDVDSETLTHFEWIQSISMKK
jgi:hypothetical protein